MTEHCRVITIDEYKELLSARETCRINEKQTGETIAEMQARIYELEAENNSLKKLLLEASARLNGLMQDKLND